MIYEYRIIVEMPGPIDGFGAALRRRLRMAAIKACLKYETDPATVNMLGAGVDKYKDTDAPIIEIVGEWKYGDSR